jgi:hypothetical protein
MAHPGGALMTEPAEVPDPGQKTTIEISRGQRAAISDIQADLVIARGRHVTTKETVSVIIDFWKEHHPHDSNG